MSSNDHAYMARALELARRGRYTTQPNPRVGCVIVKDGEIVGEGFHARAGEPHAEVFALRMAGEQARGATAYVTLEPCSHHGRTPPCADALVKAGLARVVAAMLDPNPLVGGKGMEKLRAAGIETASGLLEAEARALNPGYLRRIAGGLPFVRVKLAMSLDGRTAMASGESQWITGPDARRDVQKLRAQSGAIITGVGTVLADDPSLTVRPEDWLDWPLGLAPVQPLRVIVDSELQTEATAKILHQQGQAVIATVHPDEDVAEDNLLRRDKAAMLAAAGAEVWELPTQGGKVSLPALLEKLRDAQVNDVLVEAGPTLAGAFVAAGLVDELIVYQAPTLLGSAARPLLELPLSQMSEQKRLRVLDQRQVGADLKLTFGFVA